METDSVGKGTIQITYTNAIQYVVMGLFYVVVTKTNALTAADLGVLSILSFVASVLHLSTLTLPTALTKFVSEHLGRNESLKAASVQRAIARAVLIFSLVGLAVVTVLSPLLSEYFWRTAENALLIILISISAFLMNLVTLYTSGLRALCLFGKMAFVTLIYILSSRIIAIVLALLNFGVSGVVFGYIIGTFIGVATAFGFTRGKFHHSDNKTPIKPLLQFSLPLFLSSLAVLIVGQADVIVLASITSDYALVGVYSVAVKSLLVLSVIYQPIMVTIFPVVSAQYGLQNPAGVSSALRMTSRYLAYTIIPSCILLVMVAPTALNVFYGPSYVSGATSLAILAISIIVLALFNLLTTTLTAIGKTKEVLQINIISALLTVALLLSLVPTFEAVGAAATRLFVLAASLILAVYILRKYVSVQLDREALWKSAVASIATMPFLFVLELTMAGKFPAIEILAVEIPAAGFIYLVSLYVLKALNDQDFELLKQSFPKFLSKVIEGFQNVMARK